MYRLSPFTSVLTPPGVGDPTGERPSHEMGPTADTSHKGALTPRPPARRLGRFQDPLLGLHGSLDWLTELTFYGGLIIKAVIQKQPHGRDAEDKVGKRKHRKLPCFQGPPSQNREAHANQEAHQTPYWFKRP